MAAIRYLAFISEKPDELAKFYQRYMRTEELGRSAGAVRARGTVRRGLAGNDRAAGPGAAALVRSPRAIRGVGDHRNAPRSGNAWV